MNRYYRQAIKWLYKRSDRPSVKGFVLGVLLVAVLGAGSASIRLTNSVLSTPENPIEDYQGSGTITSINAFTATDGSGLNELTTTSAEAGATIEWIWTQGAEDVKMTHELRSGSFTESLPHVVQPNDSSSPGKYWALVGMPQTVEGTYLVQDLSGSTNFYKIGVDSSEGSVTMGVGQTAITLSD